MPDTAQIVGGVKLLFRAAQEGLKGVGIPGVEAVAGVPLLLIEIYEKSEQNREDLDVLARHFETLHKLVIHPIEQARRRGADVHLSDDGLSMIKSLEDVLQKAEEDLAPSVANLKLPIYQRYWRQDTITTSLQTIGRRVIHAISEFMLQSEIIDHILIERVHNKALLDSLKPATDARFDASYKLPCLKGTRSDLLEDIQRELSKPRIFIVSLLGSPGTGKSAVAQSIALELKERRVLAASYFFDKNRERPDAPLRVFLSTIIHQLALSHPAYCSALIQRLQEDPSLATATEDNQLRELLLKPFESIPPLEQRLVIVIDALDECGDRLQQEGFVDLLRRCEILRHHFALFLTCRPEAPFLSWLDDAEPGGMIAVGKMDELDQAQTLHDIKAFVSVKMNELFERERRGSSAPELSHVEELARLSGGLFELAAIWLRQIRDYRGNRSLRAAIQTVLADARSLPAATPLLAVYGMILQRAYPTSSILLHATDDLKEYHRVTLAMVGRFTSTIPPSASLFFRKPNLHYLPPIYIPLEYRMDSSHVNSALALRSLVTMNESNALRRNPLDLPDPSILNDAISDLRNSVHRTFPPHFRYACLYWADHLRVEDSSRCHAPLVQWCEENIVVYLETLSLLGEVERAVPLLLNAEDWARKVNIQALTVTLLYDARRLIPMFHAAITQSAGAVYSSALPFMPDCTLRGCFSHLAADRAEVIQGRLSQWPSQTWSQAHPDGVHCVAVSLDGRHVASACGDGHVRILSAATGKVEQTLIGHYYTVYSVAFSSDGARLVSGSGDCSLCVWLSATGELEKTMKGHSQVVLSVAFSPNDLRIVSGSIDKTVRIWSVATGEQERVLEGHTKGVNAVAFSPTGLYIVSGSADNTVRIWSTVAGMRDRILTGHSNSVQSIAVSFDGTRIVSGSHDGSTRIWFAATGATEWVLKPQAPGYIESVAFSPDGEHVVSASTDLHIWSTITGAEEWVLEGHSWGFQSAAFFPDGKHIASGSHDRSVRVWSIATKHQKHALDGHRLDVNSVAFSTDGAHIVSASGDRTVRVWSTVTGAQEQILQGHNMAVRSASFSPDGLHIVSGSTDLSIRIWSTVTGEQERVLEGHEATVWSVAFSPDSRQIVSGAQDGSVRVWSVATGVQEQLVNIHSIGDLSVAFSLDGRHIVTGDLSGRSVSVWNATTGAQEKQFSAPWGQGVQTVLFALNNQVVGCVDSNGRAAYWDVSSGLALDGDDPRIPLQPWVKDGYYCARDGWLTVHGHTSWVPRYFHGRWWAHPSGVVILAPDDTEGQLVFIKLPGRA